MIPHPTRVAIVSDCPLIRRGLEYVIDRAPDLRKVASIKRIGERHYEIEDADVALLNSRITIGEMARVITRLHQRGHLVIVLSASGVRANLFASVEAGARGYLSQETEENELLAAIRIVASGRSYYSGNFNDGCPNVHIPRITDRERQILELVASGATDREIACKLNISEHTVHSHLDRLRSKTGSRRRADLTRLALQQDIAGDREDR